MARILFRLMRLTSLIISIMMMVRIFSGQTFIRTQSPESINGTVSKLRPLTLTLTVSNFGCNIPSPNFYVPEKKLNAFWHLDPYTRMSPIMRAIAHCEVTARESSIKHINFDTIDCYCTGSWPVVALVSIMSCALFNLCRLVFGSRGEEKDPLSKQGFLSFNYAGLKSGIPVIFMMVAFFVFATTDHLGFSYWSYGFIFPQKYYTESADWDYLRLLALINYYVGVFEFHLCWITYGIRAAFAIWKASREMKKSVPKVEVKKPAASVNLKSVSVIMPEQKKVVLASAPPFDERATAGREERSENVEHM